MNAKLFLGGILMIAAVAGGLLYYLLTYGYYIEVPAEDVEEVQLTSIITGEAEPILAQNIREIRGETNPLRYRACFDAETSLGTLTETYQLYDEAEPLLAPRWFSCFDGRELGAALQSGEAVAFLGTKHVHYGVDRIVAIDSVGRGYAWHQINECGEAAYAGDPVPQGCPAAPEGVN